MFVDNDIRVRIIFRHLVCSLLSLVYENSIYYTVRPCLSEQLGTHKNVFGL